MDGRSREPAGQVGLRGRARECALLDELVSAIRRGESRSLLVLGEAGIGKTALLEYLIASASDTTVVRAVGVQSDMELAFASLHQLCAPLLERLERLPAPQRDALRIVFGLSGGAPPDRYLVGLAVLSLLSEAAEERPLLCVVDDAQWLDRASALTLAFVARRLLAESVAILFAAREPSDLYTGLPELVIEALADADARALLASVIPGRLDERVAGQFLAETRGNPLAVLELPRGRSAAQLRAGSGCRQRCPFHEGSRRASYGGSRPYRRTPSGFYWWARQSLSVTQRSCGARPSSSGSKVRCSSRPSRPG